MQYIDIIESLIQLNIRLTLDLLKQKMCNRLTYELIMLLEYFVAYQRVFY